MAGLTPGFHKHECRCGYQWECGCDWPLAAPSCKPCEDAWFEAELEYEEWRDGQLKALVEEQSCAR